MLASGVQYLLGAVVGFVALPLLVGALWMVALFYAEWIGGFDTKNDRFSEIVAGSVLVAPFVGLVVGIVLVARRRRRVRSRRAAPRVGRPVRGA